MEGSIKSQHRLLALYQEICAGAGKRRALPRDYGRSQRCLTDLSLQKKDIVGEGERANQHVWKSTSSRGSEQRFRSSVFH